MTINYGPVCTCGSVWPTYPYAYPCPVHGQYRYAPPLPATTTTGGMVYSVCQGRHCAHDYQCNKTYTT